MIRLALLYPVLCFVLMGAHLMFHGYGLAMALLTLIPAARLRKWLRCSKPSRLRA